MAGDSDVTDFDNLILDEDPLERLTADDKAYLETFTKLEMISLAHLAASTSITTLKLANNKIDSVSDLLALKALTSLTNLDLEGNPVCEKDDY